jgi:phage virion morphogenesis protein
MAGALFAIRIDRAEIGRVLRRARLISRDLGPVLRVLGSDLVAATQGRFESQTDPDGNRWQPLADRTRVARVGGTRRIFTRSGGLKKGAVERMGALQALLARGHLRDSITYEADRQSLMVGSGLVYAALHQFGGNAGRGKKVTVAARPFLGLSPADEEQVARLGLSHLQKAFT